MLILRRLLPRRPPSWGDADGLPPRGLSEDSWLPPRPWAVRVAPALVLDAEGLPQMSGEDDAWQPPRPWTAPRVAVFTADEEALPQGGLDEDAWQPPLPWRLSPRGLLWCDDAASLPPAVGPLDDGVWLPGRPWAADAPRGRLAGEEGSAAAS